MVYSGLSDSSTISQFTRRKAITITTDGTSTLSNYQVKLIITYETEMQADFDDLRFNTRDGDYIDYWIESYTASTTAVVWVELPDAITDPGSDIIWMYHGNGGLSDGGNGNDTFIQWHGVASANFVDALVIPYSSYIWEGRIRTTSTPHDIHWGIGTVSDASDDCAELTSYSPNNNRYLQVRNEGSATSVSETPSLTVNQWYKGKIAFDGTTVYGYADENEISSGGVATNLPNENVGLNMHHHTGTGEQEWSFARKYITNEPTLSYGTAQHQRRISQFIG